MDIKLSTLRYGLIALISVSFFSAKSLARPTKEEKASRRAAYWGLLADVYRANTCLERGAAGEPCVRQALDDAKTHAPKVDVALGDSAAPLLKDLEQVDANFLTKDSLKAKVKIRSILSRLMNELGGNTAPVLQPSREMGQQVFSEYCQSCHGDGLGSAGPLAKQLRSVPQSFNGPERSATQSPFGIYAVMIHGIDGGEMASSLDVLSVDELWAVAFYVTSLGHQKLNRDLSEAGKSKLKSHAQEFALSTLALSTDDDLRERLINLGFECGNCQAELSYLRALWPWTGEAGRLGSAALNPRQKSESRAMALLLGVIVLVSGGFIYILKRSGRVDE